MSLDNVMLPPDLIFKLYGNNLVNADKKIVLIGLNKHPEKEEKLLLDKILTACGLDLKLLTLKIFDKNPEDLNVFLANKNVNFALLFGLTPSHLHNLENYTIGKLNGGHIILSENLDTLSKNMESKKLLWKCIQQLINQEV